MNAEQTSENIFTYKYVFDLSLVFNIFNIFEKHHTFLDFSFILLLWIFIMSSSPFAVLLNPPPLPQTPHPPPPPKKKKKRNLIIEKFVTWHFYVSFYFNFFYLTGAHARHRLATMIIGLRTPIRVIKQLVKREGNILYYISISRKSLFKIILTRSVTREYTERFSAAGSCFVKTVRCYCIILK